MKERILNLMSGKTPFIKIGSYNCPKVIQSWKTIKKCESYDIQQIILLTPSPLPHIYKEQ